MSCRFCFVPALKRSDLKYDIIFKRKYHHETMQMWKEMTSITVKTRQTKYARNTEMQVEESALIKISSVLNIIRSRSDDSAHSEYNNVIKLLHLFLMSAILTSVAQKIYTTMLRSFSYSSDWSRLQSSQHHLHSYQLQKHARWSIITVTLLWIWLREQHIQSFYLQSIISVNDLDSLEKSNLIVNIIHRSFDEIS